MTGEKVHTLTSKGVPNRRFQVFKSMKNERKLCDITFNVGGEHISAHRIIIFAAMPYFSTMQSDGGSRDSEVSISLPYIEPNAFQCLIEYAYASQITIDMNNAMNLLSAAWFLGVEEVSDACIYFLNDNLEPENVLKIRNVAYELKCSELLGITDSYVTEYFDQVSQTDDFLECPFAYVKELIRKDTLNASSEQNIFEAVMKWTKSSVKDRACRLPELLVDIRMPLLKPECLANILKTEDLIRGSMQCRVLLDEARDYHFFPERRKEKQCTFSTKSRLQVCSLLGNGKEIIYKLGAAIKFTVQSYDLKRPKWITKERTKLFVNGGSTTKLHEKVYFFYWGYTLEYDTRRDAYQYLKNMPTVRIFAGAVSLKDKIYVCGGKLCEVASDVVECFDPVENEWEEIKVMPTSCWSPSTVSLADCIYVLGGRSNYTVLDCVHRYDPAKSNWTSMSRMLTRRYQSAAASLNGKIYICGGRTHLTDVVYVETAEVFDPNTNRWDYISSMNIPRGEFSLLSSHLSLYALGGRDNNGKHVLSFDVYDPEKDKWISNSSSDSKYVASGAVMVGDDGKKDREESFTFDMEDKDESLWYDCSDSEQMSKSYKKQSPFECKQQ